MKKRIGIGVLAGILVLLAVGMIWFFSKGLTISLVRCIITRQGCMMVQDNAPVIMHNRSWQQELFEDLSTGDKILVVHDALIAESYPGQTTAYFCIKLQKGSGADVPAEVVTALEELGYIIEYNYEEFE